MHLKPSIVYGGRWYVDRRAGRPLSETTYRVYLGQEVAEAKPALSGRQAFLKVARYGDDPAPEDILLRRKALERQRDILALEHFMLPEPLDFCAIDNPHDPAISGTERQKTEPLLVYAYSPGDTLRRVIESNQHRRPGEAPAFSPLEALDTIIKITDGLTYLHEQGYGHAALNPDHLLYHNGSLRFLGLSKIGTIDPATHYLQLVEPPYLLDGERIFLPREALVRRRFGLGAEYYALALLYLYLVTGVAPSREAVPLEQQVDELPLCEPLRALLKGWLADWQRPYGGDVEAGYIAQLAAVQNAQGRYEADRRLAAARIGIFVDYENVQRSLAAERRPDYPITLDLEALAAAYREGGAVYKFVVIPQFRMNSRTRPMLEDLERAGWDVHVVGAAGGPEAGLAESDDAALVQAATRFLDHAQPLRLVIVANDRDYLELISRARFRKIPVTVVLSRSPLLMRQSVSADYRRQLDEKQVEIRLLGSFPYIFAEETRQAFWEMGLRRPLPVAYANQYKSLLWTLHRAAGRQAALDWLTEARKQMDVPTVLDVLKPLRFYDMAHHPFVVARLLQAKSAAAEITRLRQQQRLLARFDPGRLDLLQDVYQNATHDPDLIQFLSRAPDGVTAHWDFLRQHLGEKERPLVELFAQPFPLSPQLAAAIKADPQRYLALCDKLPKDLARELPGLLVMHGPAAWDVAIRHQERGLKAIHEFGEEAIRVLSGPSAEFLLDALDTAATAKLLREWHKTTNDLAAAPLLALNPELQERARRAGPEGGAVVLQIFRDEGTLAAVDEVRDLAATTSYKMAGAYGAWRQLRQAGWPTAEIIRRAEQVAGLTPPVFRPDLPPSTYTQLCLAVYQVSSTGNLERFLSLYRALKPEALLDVYLRHGADLFPIVEATDPFVVNWLRLFPDVFPALQRYGPTAYALLRQYKDAARRALVDLRGHDLGSLLGDALVGRLLAAWHAERQDLGALAFLAREPILLEWVRYWAQRRGGDVSSEEQAALEVLSIYSGDPDLSRLQAALEIAQAVSCPLSDAHTTLRDLNQPAERIRPLFQTQGRRIFTLPDAATRLSAGRAFMDAAAKGYEDDLAGLFDSQQGNAIAAYNRFGVAALLLARTLSPDVIPLLQRFPGALPSLERYGRPAYQFIQDYNEQAVKLLEQAAAHDLGNALSEVARPWVQAWRQGYGNLDLVLLLAEQWRLMALLQQHGWRPAQAWYNLRSALGPGGFVRIEQLAPLLADTVLEQRVIWPLVNELAPGTFAVVVKRYYDELRRYPDTAAQARLCRVLGETLRDEFPRHADRYVTLAAGCDRPALLDVVEKVGRPAIDLLEPLPPQTRQMILAHGQRAPTGQTRATIAAWLPHSAWLVGQSQATQVKAIQAADRQPVRDVVETWKDYGDEGLDEVILKGGIGFFFRLMHHKRR